MAGYTEYNPNSHLFPNQAVYGRDPELYPKKSEHLMSTGGWTDVEDVDKDNIITAVVDALKADGVFDDITVDEDKIANKVVNYLKANDMLGDSITDDVIDQVVAATIKKITDDKLFVGPKGDPGPKGDKGDKGDPGQDGADGQPGEDADPTEVANILKADSTFVASLKGEKGDPGQDGASADANDVADVLKADTDFVASLKGEKGDPGEPGEAGADGQPGQDGKDADPADVANTLKADEEFLASVKGDKGDPGDGTAVEVDTEAIKGEVIEGIRQDIKDGYQHILNDAVEVGMFTANGEPDDLITITEVGMIPLIAPVNNTSCNIELTKEGKIKLKAGKTYMVSASLEVITNGTLPGYIRYNLVVYPSEKNIISFNQVAFTDTSAGVSHFMAPPIPYKVEEDCELALYCCNPGDNYGKVTIRRSCVSVMELAQPIVNEIRYSDTLLEFGRFSVGADGYTFSTNNEKLSFDHKVEYGTLSLNEDGYIMLHGGKRYSIDLNAVVSSANTASSCALVLYDVTHDEEIPDSLSYYGITVNNKDFSNNTSGVIFAPEEDCIVTVACRSTSGAYNFYNIWVSVQEIAVPVQVQYGSEDIAWGNFHSRYDDGLILDYTSTMFYGFHKEYSDMNGISLDDNGYIKLQGGKTYVFSGVSFFMADTVGQEISYDIWDIYNNISIEKETEESQYRGFNVYAPYYGGKYIPREGSFIIYTPVNDTKICVRICWVQPQTKISGMNLSVHELAREVVKEVKYPNYDLEVGTFKTGNTELIKVSTGDLIPLGGIRNNTYGNIKLTKDGYIPLKSGKLYSIWWDINLQIPSANNNYNDIESVLYDVTNNIEIGAGGNYDIVRNREEGIHSTIFYKPDTDCEVVVKVAGIHGDAMYHTASVSVQEIATPKIYNMKYDGSDIEYATLFHTDLTNGFTLTAGQEILFEDASCSLHNMEIEDNCIVLHAGKTYGFVSSLNLIVSNVYVGYGLYDKTHDRWLGDEFGKKSEPICDQVSTNTTYSTSIVERIISVDEDCKVCYKVYYVSSGAKANILSCTIREIARPVKEEIVYDTRDISYARFDTGNNDYFVGKKANHEIYVSFGDEQSKKFSYIHGDDISLTEEGYVKLKAGKTYKLSPHFISNSVSASSAQIAVYDMTHHIFPNGSANWTDDQKNWQGAGQQTITYTAHNMIDPYECYFVSPEEDTVYTVLLGEGSNVVYNDGQVKLFVEEVARPVIEKQELVLSGQIPEVGTYIHRNYPITIGGLISFATDSAKLHSNLELTSEGYIVLHKGKTYKISAEAATYLSAANNYVSLAIYNVTEGEYIGALQDDGVTPEALILNSVSSTGNFSIPDGVYYEAKKDTVITLKVVNGNGVTSGSNFSFIGISVQEIMQPVKLEAKPETPDCGVFESIKVALQFNKVYGFQTISPGSYSNMKMDENGYVKLKGGKVYSLSLAARLGNSQTQNSKAAGFFLYDKTHNKQLTTTDSSNLGFIVTPQATTHPFSSHVQDIIYAPEEDCVVGFQSCYSDINSLIAYEYIALKVMEIAQPITMEYHTDAVGHALCLANHHAEPVTTGDTIKFTKLENSNMELDENGHLKLTAGKTYMIYPMIYSHGAASWVVYCAYDVTHDKFIQYGDDFYPSQLAVNASSTDNSVTYPCFYTPEEDCSISIHLVARGNSAMKVTYAYMTVLEVAQPVVDKKLLDETKEEVKKELKQEFVTAMQSQVLDEQAEVGTFCATLTNEAAIQARQDEYIPLIGNTPGSYTNMALYDGKIKLTAGKTYLISGSIQTIGTNNQIGWNIRVVETGESICPFNQNVFTDNTAHNISHYQYSPIVFKPETDCHVGPYINYSDTTVADLERVTVTVQEVKQPVINNINADSWDANERVVGIWLDGRPLYEKCITLTPAENHLYYHPEAIDMLISKEAHITLFDQTAANGVKYDQYLQCGSNIANYYASVFEEAGKSFIGYNIQQSSWNGATIFAKIQYTKTKDKTTS